MTYANLSEAYDAAGQPDKAEGKRCTLLPRALPSWKRFLQHCK